jgi:hypothetical protein
MSRSFDGCYASVHAPLPPAECDATHLLRHYTVPAHSANLGRHAPTTNNTESGPATEGFHKKIARR